MNKIFIASNNAHKIGEIRNILRDNGIDAELLCPKDFNDRSEPVENGKSFKENAFIKAEYYFNKYHYPTLADDSGICIDYLNGLPGIHSSRFYGEYDYHEKNQKVLRMMKNVKNRKACFYDVICYIEDKNKISYFEGINPGEIALEEKGNEGFGYDPIFLIPEYNKTEAELGDAFKNENSHRAKALKKWAEYVR